ncbi:uncharacterized protein LOC110906535 [Helianthus annuus]|uniref:uncharacterized protein LOC110906535 n=1 Tax=Helianthus annuus TaxID=4232 RepID=UPI000B90A35E|nr:uncharacterized protein LOC110906535 [Helianthus annuus]
MEVKEDSWGWLGDKDGKFLAALVRKLLIKERAECPLQPLEWCKWLPAKVNIFVWRTGMYKIPTRKALAKRNIQIPELSCVFCEESDEDADHLFSGCPLVQKVWQNVCKWARIPELFAFEVKDVLEHYKFCESRKDAREVVKGLFMLGCWCVWKSRNSVVFSKGTGRSEDIMGDIKSLGFLWLDNRSKYRGLDWVEWCKYPMYML